MTNIPDRFIVAKTNWLIKGNVTLYPLTVMYPTRKQSSAPRQIRPGILLKQIAGAACVYFITTYPQPARLSLFRYKMSLKERGLFLTQIGSEIPPHRFMTGG